MWAFLKIWKFFCRLSLVDLLVYRGSVGQNKKFQNSTVDVSIVCQGTHIRCKYYEHVLWSWKPTLAKKDPRLFLRDHDPGRSHGFWLKLQWKKFGRRATSKAKPPVLDRGWKSATYCTETQTSTSAHSKEKMWRNRRAGQAASWTGSNQDGLCLTIRKRPALFLKPTEVQSRTKFAIGLSVGWVIDREEAERSHRCEATKLSGARTTGWKPKNVQNRTRSTHRSFVKEHAYM